MNRTISLRCVIPILLLATFLLSALAQPSSAQPKKEKTPPATQPKAASARTSASEELVPLKIKLPKPYFVDDGHGGTPHAPVGSKHFDYQTLLDPPMPVLAPWNIKRLSLYKTVTSSGKIVDGNLTQMTDGDKNCNPGCVVELSPGVQWVQLDLGEPFDVFAMILWHDYHNGGTWIYRDVVVRCADDPDFITGVKTLFNNDHDNSAGFGCGKDLEYAELYWGKPIDCKDKQGKPVRTRYIRFYSNGSNTSEMNHYIEVEVYGRPVTTQPKKELALLTTAPQASDAQTSASEALVPLEIKLPHIRSGTIRKNPYSINYAPRPIFMAPKGVRLLSFHKKVIASGETVIGKVELVNDGDKDDLDGNYLELAPGVQWVQIDLGEQCDVYAIVIWRHYLYEPVYHDVILRSADEPDFKRGVRTLFNNDFDNSAELGKGTDQEYVETGQGKMIDCKDKQGQPTRTRTIRCYSNGNNHNDLNHYVEVEVYGRPCAKTK